MSKNFALIGAAGYVAERHIRAIKETGNKLKCSLDKFDVMGRMDQYFPKSEFFLHFEKFEKFIEDERIAGDPIDFVSICSPNFLHASHIQYALVNKMDAICEKPLVLYPDEVELLEKIEKNSGQKVWNILQLRLHPSIINLKKTVENNPTDKIYDIDVTYIASRGKWYFKSWKVDEKKSGGVATNIGIHLFDMLFWIFGAIKRSVVHHYDIEKASGYLELEKARVRWFLSLDADDLPVEALKNGKTTFRSISVEGGEIEFSEGFTDLHTQTYQNVLNGEGYGLHEAKPCILLTHELRNAPISGLTGDYHPFLKSLK